MCFGYQRYYGISGLTSRRSYSRRIRRWEVVKGCSSARLERKKEIYILDSEGYSSERGIKCEVQKCTVQAPGRIDGPGSDWVLNMRLNCNVTTSKPFSFSLSPQIEPLESPAERVRLTAFLLVISLSDLAFNCLGRAVYCLILKPITHVADAG